MQNNDVPMHIADDCGEDIFIGCLDEVCSQHVSTLFSLLMIKLAEAAAVFINSYCYSIVERISWDTQPTRLVVELSVLPSVCLSHTRPPTNTLTYTHTNCFPIFRLCS